MSSLASASRSATVELLQRAVHRSSVLTIAGLRERAFTRAFEDLVYPQIWEDPVVDLEALDMKPGCRIVAIASGGCNVLSYLLADPASITAVDLNTAHVALTRLKLAAASHLHTHDRFHRLFANAADAKNIEIYDRVLRHRLDPFTRNYWDGRSRFGRRRIEMLSRGLYRHGLLGRFIAAAHLLGRMLGADPRIILTASNQKEQREIYQRTLAPLFRRRLVRWLLNSPASLFGLGIPPTQYRALADGSGGGMVDVVEQRLARLACDFDLRDNYFAWQAFGRQYDPRERGALPPYLVPRNFETIKARAGRVDVRLASLTQHLTRQPNRSIDCFVLLDAQDWMTDTDLTNLWREITRTAQPHARVIFRTAGKDSVLPGRIPQSLLDRWCYEHERSAELHRRDRSAIYGGFHLYELGETHS
jgi:S-adenosylmethionine-diacylglycerol 3-amino-3-carboxypropyl transferase